jgi:hypothetical protein
VWRLLATRTSTRIDWPALVKSCAEADIAVSDRRLSRGCNPRWLKLDRQELASTGGIAIYLGARPPPVGTDRPLKIGYGASSTGEMRMPEYVIEREMPGVGSLGKEELKGASQTSCSVLRELGPEIQWVNSYVTDDKIYCIYRAPNEDMIREHAQKGGFPANRISQVRSVIDPTTAE